MTPDEREKVFNTSCPDPECECDPPETYKDPSSRIMTICKVRMYKALGYVPKIHWTTKEVK